MPPAFLYDLTGIDLDKVLYGPDEIRKFNQQRYEFEMLEAVTYVDGPAGRIIGYKDIRAGEFWERGHIPGRPLFPGVLQIELAAQLAGFYTGKVLKWEGFLGFAGVESVRFRQQITPGCRLHVIVQQTYAKHRRVGCKAQGLIKGTLAFEAEIVGTLI
jgi:3-hydroxyacyl-[acyl-carrier-protein] dehydratase